MKTPNASLGVTEDDAANYGEPFVSAHPKGWWTLDENKDLPTANKWYGNGHAVSVTKKVDSLSKLAAAFTFMKWYAQGQDSNGVYNLATWGNGGHIPAWKNVYDSQGYKDIASSNITLTALGDPADIIAMESLAYESTVFNGVGTAISTVQNRLKAGEDLDADDALQIVEEVAESTQDALDLLAF